MSADAHGRFGRIAAAVAVAVADVNPSLAFFRDLLGMAVTFTNGNPIGFVIVRRDEAELHLTLVKNHRPASHNVAHLRAGRTRGHPVHVGCARHGVPDRNR